jgi:hypothetical protein
MLWVQLWGMGDRLGAVIASVPTTVLYFRSAADPRLAHPLEHNKKKTLQTLQNLYPFLASNFSTTCFYIHYVLSEFCYVFPFLYRKMV